MSNISDAMLEALLEEITDYEELQLSEAELNELETRCSRRNDTESIKSEINIYVQEIGYKYDKENFKWRRE